MKPRYKFFCLFYNSPAFKVLHVIIFLMFGFQVIVEEASPTENEVNIKDRAKMRTIMEVNEVGEFVMSSRAK